MEKYDSALLGILQNEGKVAPFLDVILGFLYRRTDFFRVMKTDHDNLGFPPGIAKKLLVNIFSKYESQALRDAVKYEEMKKTNELKKKMEEKNVPVATNEQIDLPLSEPVPNTSSEEVQNTPIVPSEISQIASIDKKEAAELVEPAANTDDKMDTDSQAVHSEHQEGSKDEGGSEEKEDPEQARQRRFLQANPLTYNGAERDNYYWSQTIAETDLRVKVPKFIVKGKQARVDITKKHIHVSHQKEDGAWQKVVDNSLAWEINTEESMWTLTPGEFVHLNLEKREERWWECVFEDEPKINTRKIDCSRPMTDLDDEAQAKIEEMMYNQRQKQLGLPQSHEQKTHEMLRKAWDAEGSPFKGQPFDPSRLNIDPNGVINMNQS